jgi:hypothetical protein
MSNGERKISEVTRREIADRLTASGVSWSGRFRDDEFLARLYDLEQMPSRDYRYRTASRDIWQHTVNNNDLGPDWVFYDDRFNLLHGPDQEFLRFLCEMVHPVVRPDADVARRLADEFNAQLAKDGWELYPDKEISGRPVFGARQIGGRVEIFEEPTGWPKVDRQMSEARDRLRAATNEEQFQAVGLLCRETLISLAQTVYDAQRYPTLDGIAASNTDAKRMLEAFIAVELGGAANEEARRHARAALSFAVALQHDRTADFRAAALCAEATASVVNVVGILSGARAPTSS